MTLHDIFSKYTGQEVMVQEKRVADFTCDKAKDLQFKDDGEMMACSLDPNDGVIKALCADFKRAKIEKVAFQVAGHLPEMDCRQDCVNVIILKGEKDKYCIMGFTQT